MKKRDLSLTFGSGIDELSSVHSFNSDEIRSTMLVFVLVSENNLGKRSSSARVVYNVLNNALNVPNKKHRVSLVMRKHSKVTLLMRWLLTRFFRQSPEF